MEFPRCASGSGAADNSVHQLSLVIRNIFNVFETLISEVHQHDTASESSGCEKKNFSTDAVANCRRLRISTVSSHSRRTKELRDKSSRRGIHEHRDGSINRDRDVRVRFCAGPVECATKPLSTPAGGKTVPCSLKIGANA